ncbi:hypothetical protein LJC68_02355 [Bacteroidales bacterium OttesenSCG-928-B11]|nr:hypothetical protein [Bacteroidales bacterium OttesenSCG-928-C03]MDL2311704.1 hypothetical protein [Bacteroidales bacterium OttesenSCG-928-B11]MDL2325897.1 hypothetical protein [Bacteroidales bacterium OttesenSCG-928-A14]
MKIFRLITILAPLIFIISQDIYSQNYSNQRIKTIALDSIVVKFDSLSVISNSVHIIYGATEEQIEIDYLGATIALKDTSLIGSRLALSYRIFNFDIVKTYQHKSTDIILRNISHRQPQPIPITTFSDFMRDDAAFVSAGSISRGFSMGNNQDVVLSSTLNLQLSGMLSEDLEVNANITDRSLPIQPEGNTAMIQDFDRIFINLKYKNQYVLDAGDIDVDGRKSHFMILNKRLLGMDLHGITRLDSANSLYNQVGGGVNKGKFMRQQLSVINGVQGPYKLRGEQSELNIIVLSGSERVYLDGRLLSRGADNDYVIDYNTGEITFTSRILMTTEKRITIEFQYRSDYFSHYTLFTANEFIHEKNNKLKIGVNFYHDQDQKNRSIQPELDNDQKLFLSEIGDNFANAFYRRADSVGYNPNEILYVRTDTIVEGVHYEPVYIHSTNNEDELYRLSFSLVGERNGNYQLDRNTANGRVFRWVAPIDGVPQGNYEPVIRLVTPKLLQLGTVSAEYTLKGESWIRGELAVSNHDQNTFSDIDDADNVGFAVKLEGFNKSKVFQKKSDDWRWENKINYEFLSKNFYVSESFRDVEFARNFNLSEEYSARYSEHFLQFNTNLRKEKSGFIGYALNLLSRPTNVNIFKNHLHYDFKKNGFSIIGTNSFLNSHDSLQNSRFFQTNQQLTQVFKFLEIGFKDIAEINLFKTNGQDSLIGNSYAFNEATIFLKNNDTLPYLFNITYMNRLEYDPQTDHLVLQNMHNEIRGSFEISRLKNNRIKGNLTYRNSQIADSTRRFSGENFLTGSLEYTGRFLKNSIILSTFYEIGSGLEQKRTFSYLRVADGQGSHTWIDYNENGIEELDEFEIAAFQDQANYVKIWINTTDYITTSNNRFTQTIQLQPRNIWGNKKGILKFLARFGNVASFQASQKNTVENSFSAYNPFNFGLEDSLLVNSNVNFFNNLSFNQMGKYWGVDYLAKATQDKNLLYYGFEQNRTNSHEVILRITPHKKIILRINLYSSHKKNNSEYLPNKAYHIEQNSAKGFLQYTHDNSIYTSLAYTYKTKKNILGTEKLYQHQLEYNINYRIASKVNLAGLVQWNNIRFNAPENTSISYEMLEGLQNGQNLVWALSCQSSITDFLQIELSYSGRVSESNRAIHLANIQLRAHF